MAWSDQYTQYGMAGLAQAGSFITSLRQRKAAKAWQEYNNKLVRIQDAQNQNTITTNENLARERSAVAEFAIRKSGMITAAKIENSAAATGTEGRSVERALFQSSMNVANASRSRQKDLEGQYLQMQQQREQSAMQAQMSLDIKSIPMPNPATYLLGFASDATDIRNRTR